MSTIWCILLAIGIIDYVGGMTFTWKSDRKKVLMGWALMAIGLVFNGLACLSDIDGAFDIIMAIISFGVAYVDYRVFRENKKNLT